MIFLKNKEAIMFLDTVGHPKLKLAKFSLFGRIYRMKSFAFVLHGENKTVLIYGITVRMLTAGTSECVLK
jgi:hypothetical protein